MESQITLRLPKELERRLREKARALGLKRSDVARLALRSFLAEEPKRPGTPYERVADLIGAVSSGISDLGERHREHLLKRLRRSA